MPTIALDVPLPDGRVLRAYDTGVPDGAAAASTTAASTTDASPDASTADASTGRVLMWHHGSPQTGAPLEPVVAAATRRGIRVISYGRPSYGGSTARPGRDVASAGDDAIAVADAFGVDRFDSMGASGGGPHALAVAARHPERVTGVVTLAGLAPCTDRFDWFAGMRSPGGLRSALEGGRAGRARYAGTAEFDPEQFLAVDFAALDGGWSDLGADVAKSAEFGDDGLIDDDVAFVNPWGFDLAEVAAPVLIVQGEGDRVVPRTHASWLLAHLPDATLWMRLDDGHVSVLDVVPDAMDWLLER